MPDGLIRLHNSGQAHFITFSCYRRQPLLFQMQMQDSFLQALEENRHKFDIRVFGYVLMPEHVHLLISEPCHNSIPKFIQLLKTRVAIRARWEHRRSPGSPFWQARYFDHNVRNRAGFVTQLRYIHRNPVKRRLCEAPEDWPWSSFRAWALGETHRVTVECEMVQARARVEAEGEDRRERPSGVG